MVPIYLGYTSAAKERIKLSGETGLNTASRIVEDIIDNIRSRGDEALFEYTKRLDGHELTKGNVLVSKNEIADAYSTIKPRMKEVILNAKARIVDFHLKQKRYSWMDTTQSGEMMGQLIRPLENVGVYVPGGKASYPSSVLMNVLPAKVAGVKRIFMATPASKEGTVNPAVLVAAEEAGVDAIYKIGGAQAVAAMAFGTESVPRVDKIVGPGNFYVAAAKRAVYGFVDIDSFAGPSEILVIADKTANPAYVAADMLSQAEHDELASSVLLTTSEELAKRVQDELVSQTELLERKDIINESLNNRCAIIVVRTIEKAIRISNIIAPEHLEICTREPFSHLPLITNAGAVFLGHYTPEPLGDYMAGPNHVLPTGGTARYFSPLSVDDFIKKTSIMSFSKEALSALSADVEYFAESEGLTAHANAIRLRFKENGFEKNN